MTAIEEGTPSRLASLAWIATAYAVALGAALAAGWPLHEAGYHPLWVLGAADLAGTVAVFAFSVLLDNSSVYDPYWSVVPPLIGAYLLLGAGPPASWPRAVVCLGLVTLWGARLTFNWIRRWQGLSHEDWRYVDIRAKTGRAQWPASFVGVHLLPSGWVFAGCLPLLPALSASAAANTGFGVLDALALVVTAAAILIEALADRQLHRHLASPPAGESFLRSGLWAHCRHPNYLGELLLWWGVYGFGLAAAPGAWWWTALGPVSITLLFVAISVPMIDRRMRARRPGYDEWMRRVPGLVPRPWRR